MASPLINRLRSIWRQYPDPRVFAWTLVILARQTGYYSFKTNDDFFRMAAGIPSDPIAPRYEASIPEEVILDELRKKIEYLLSDQAKAEFDSIDANVPFNDRWIVKLRFYDKLPFGFRYEWFGRELGGLGRFTDLVKWVAKEVNRWIRAGAPRTITLQGGVEVERHPMHFFMGDLNEIHDWFIVARPRPDIMRMTMEQVSRAQVEWHNQMRIQEEERVAQMREAERAQLRAALNIPAIHSTRGYELYPLKTKEQLKAQGCDQGICVGRTNMPYWRGVQAGTTEIYGVRKDGRIIATMEARIYTESGASGPAGRYGTFVQIKGPNNADIEDLDDIYAIRAFARWLGYRLEAEPFDTMFEHEAVDGLSGFVARFGRR